MFRMGQRSARDADMLKPTNNNHNIVHVGVISLRGIRMLAESIRVQTKNKIIIKRYGTPTLEVILSFKLSSNFKKYSSQNPRRQFTDLLHTPLSFVIKIMGLKVSSFASK